MRVRWTQVVEFETESLESAKRFVQEEAGLSSHYLQEEVKNRIEEVDGKVLNALGVMEFTTD